MQQPKPSVQTIQNLEAHLDLLVNLKQETKDEEFCLLMNKARDALGERGRKMARFYYQYGCYLLSKIQNNSDIFGKLNTLKEQQEQKLVAIKEVEESLSDMENEEDQPSPANKEAYAATDPDQPVILTEGKEDKGEVEAEVEEDQEQLCFQNLQVALSILMDEWERHQNSEIILTAEELAKLQEEIIKARIAIGDLQILKEDIATGIKEYEEALEIRSRLPGKMTDRMYASIHNRIGLAYTYEDDNQQKSRHYFLAGVDILISNLAALTNRSDYERPNKVNAKVNRLEYLPTINDAAEVKDVKELILAILDKLEDIDLQLMERETLQKLKKDGKGIVSSDNRLEPVGVANEGKTPINLGTFGSGSSKASNPIIRMKNPVQNTSLPTNTTGVESGQEPVSTEPKLNFQSKRLAFEQSKQQDK